MIIITRKKTEVDIKPLMMKRGVTMRKVAERMNKSAAWVCDVKNNKQWVTKHTAEKLISVMHSIIEN